MITHTSPYQQSSKNFDKQGPKKNLLLLLKKQKNSNAHNQAGAWNVNEYFLYGPFSSFFLHRKMNFKSQPSIVFYDK